MNGDTPREAVGTEVTGGVVAGLRAFLTAKSRRGRGGDDRCELAVQLAWELAVELARGWQGCG